MFRNAYGFDFTLFQNPRNGAPANANRLQNNKKADPPMDSLKDLWTLLHFMMPDLFGAPSLSRPASILQSG